MSNGQPVNRRRFFRAALGELLDRASAAAGPINRAMADLGDLGRVAPPNAPVAREPPPPPMRVTSLRILRPPGALPEDDFVSQCCRCGECVRVCPVKCITIDPGGAHAGAPYIEIDAMPCVLCDGLLCMTKCPTGAILPTPREQIKMGLAAWDADACLRSRDQDCTLCVDRCPVGPAAIELDGGEVIVKAEGCTGCGVCEYECPTSPKAIAVAPAGA